VNPESPDPNTSNRHPGQDLQAPADYVGSRPPRHFQTHYCSINTVHRVLGYPRAVTYDAAASGELRTIKIGRTRYTKPAWVTQWWEGKAQGGS
jgi:hypothetical protein